MLRFLEKAIGPHEISATCCCAGVFDLNVIAFLEATLLNQPFDQ